MSKHDQAALDAATEIMSLVNGPVGLTSDAKLKARIQVALIDLLEKHATQPAAGEPKPIAYVNYAANGQPYLDWLPGGEDESHALFGAPPAAAHGELVAVVGTVPGCSRLKSLDFKVALESLPDGTRLYAASAKGHGGEA